MKRVLLPLLAVMFIIAACNCNKTGPTVYKTISAKDANGYSYESVTNYPVGVRIYTLSNGLKVYLSVNKDAPRIQTLIAVKAGSTYDPAETTGLAHYLEHMMFKGTAKFGTVNWKKEKAALDKISDLFEQHKNAMTKIEKDKIYTKIDSLSSIAAQYAVPNEYDKMVGKIGAKNTNAFTSNEETVFMNDIPSNEMERWLTIESERFSKPVLRLFHTELEAVYEEFNISQDDDNDKVNNALTSGLFKKHPYGTQTVLGKAEHLKNPSMVNIYNYYSKYYVPNNMAICMSGDLDFEQTIKMIDRFWGEKKSSDVPEFHSPVEDSITKPIEKTVYGPDAEFVTLGYRFVNDKNYENKKYVTLINSILFNEKAGLIDLDLVQEQRVLNAYSDATFMKYYGIHEFSATVRKGQSLKQAKDLIIGEINKIRNGQFDDWMLQAAINNLKLERIKGMESNRRAFGFVNAFVNSITWADVLKFNDDLATISKQDIINFAKKNYADNYVVVYKKIGKDTTVVKVDKPKITPVQMNRDQESEFYKKLSAIKPSKLQPVFVDYDKEISRTDLSKDVEINYIKNKTNELFSLEYIIDMGKNHDLKLPIAVNYLQYLGTDKYTAAQFQQELFKYGLSFGVFTGDDRSYVSISGLDKSFEKGLELLEHILANAKPDKKAYNNYVDGILKERTDDKLNKDQILWGGMFNYGMFGKFSTFTNIVPEQELKKIDPSELTRMLKELYSYKHKIFYYGQRDINDVKKVVAQFHKAQGELKTCPAPVTYTEQPTDKNKVYFVNYDMVQANILMLTKDTKFNKELYPEINLFNQYFDGNSSSVVFQEIRESKALAYSAFANFSIPHKKEYSHYIYGFVGTQANKLKMALDAMLNLMNNMPEDRRSFDESRETIMNQVESERIIKSNIFWTYQANLDRGIAYDIRKDVYEKMKTITYDDFHKFYNAHVKDKKYTFLIMGNKNDLDMSALKKFGTVEELSLRDIFNY